MSLDTRKQKLLKVIVDEYVRTALPVSSEGVAAKFDFGVRSATIRNEMAELTELGFIKQPHTSAGRIPSTIGYRFYVDALMPAPTLPPRARRQALQSAAWQAEVEQVILKSCQILSGLTRHPSVATQVVGETTISGFDLSRVGKRKLLVLLVTSDGQVEHRLLDLQTGATANDIKQAKGLLDAYVIDQPVNELLAGRPQADPEGKFSPSIWEIVSTVASAIEEIQKTLLDTHFYADGTSYISSQPEFADQQKLAAVLKLFEHGQILPLTFNNLRRLNRVSLLIGEENRNLALQSCSVIGRPYSIGLRTHGTIGILGPTRMNYARAVAAVDFMAQSLSDVLTRMSVA